MPRDYKVYLEDILQAITKVREYTSGMSPAAFVGDAKTLDAVIRNLEVIGEASKAVPETVRLSHRRWIGGRLQGYAIFSSISISNRCRTHLGYHQE